MTVPTSAQVHNHTQAVAAAKGSLQSIISTPGVSAATIKAAHVTYQQAVLASARANNHMTGAYNACLSLGKDQANGVSGDT
jgi:hypothetical protein